MTLPLSLLLGLLEQVVRHPPGIAPIEREQLRARHVEDLPPVKPPQRFALAVRLLNVRPDLLPLRRHLRQPGLTCLCVVLPVHPPLLLQPQVALEVEEQVGGRHRAAGEEVRRHPAAFEVVGRVLVGEDVHEELSGGFEEGGDFLQEELVVLHVFEELDAEDAVEGASEGGVGELVGRYVAGDDFEVGELVFLRDAVDILLLRSRVAERCDAGVGKDFGEIETQ
jgi:hypothetical protein